MFRFVWEQKKKEKMKCHFELKFIEKIVFGYTCRHYFTLSMIVNYVNTKTTNSYVKIVDDRFSSFQCIIHFAYIANLNAKLYAQLKILRTD